MDTSSNNYADLNANRVQNKYHNAVFTDKQNNADLTASDFLNLMVAQLKNQDFMNPMDDSQYVSQMAQMASMQAMSELADYSKNNYAMSLVGKEVTAARNTVSGNLDTTTGVVKKVSLVNNEYVLYIGDNGKTYKLSQIMSVGTAANKDECQVDTTKLSVLNSDVTAHGAKINWALSTEDPAVQKGLTYTAYYSTDADFNSVEAVKSKGTKIGSDLKDITVDDEKLLTKDLTGLSPDTVYYVNVLVTDANGKQTVYKASSFKTLKEE